ncbi:protein phosphatase 2C domain-containing protein [Parahaliea mediterranea]|uniref:Serine/threonine-protein phosphatase n=1 Tax=Parahaliea mediterranea TaxID=651086 RepID=A0A939IIR0_9GAMM|nr:serine/threonine-protein phosphatase [Parahaliea mediterranea]
MNTSDVVTDGCGATHVGQRNHNEDAYLLDPDCGLAVVADGVGGHQAGEVASAITCEVIQRETAAGRPVEQGIRAANREVMAAVAQGRGKAGMASTVVVARFSGGDYELAWVGDSRAYLWDGQLKLLTRDHSYVQALFSRGQITLAQARSHPRKNVIVQAIGLQEDDKLQVGINRGRLEPGQVLLLCSDGLSDALECGALSDILCADTPLAARCEALVDAAVRAGGRDNITVVLLPGTAPANGAARLEPEVTWSYDPGSGEYAGLPELDLIEHSRGPVPGRGSAPGSAEPPLPRQEPLRTSPAGEAEAARAAVQREKGRRRNRLILWFVAGVLVMASVAYSLGIAASGG